MSGEKKMRGNITFVREEHTDSYTCISNRCLQDTRLSMAARGLIVQILSLPETWTLYKAKLENYNRNSRTSIRSVMKELEENGYLKVGKDAEKLTYVVNEAPSGTVGIFDGRDVRNVHEACTNHTPHHVQNVHGKQDDGMDDVQNVHGVCTERTPDDVQNVHLLNNYKNNNNKLTTTKVSQFLLSINQLKSHIRETYGYVFSEDFYRGLIELESERGINPEDYVRWLIREKGKSADSIQNYVYKTAGNLNVVNEYIRSRERNEEIKRKLQQKDPVITCPDCGHTFKSIDIITRRCICGLSLDEILGRNGGKND